MQINFFSSKFPDTHVQCKLRVNYVEKNCFTMKPQWRSVDRFRGVTRGAQTPSAESLWGRRITAVGAEKSPQCHKYFLQYSAFASERPQFRKWGAKLASWPGRHLTSLRPWRGLFVTWTSFQCVKANAVLRNDALTGGWRQSSRSVASVNSHKCERTVWKFNGFYVIKVNVTFHQVSWFKRFRCWWNKDSRNTEQRKISTRLLAVFRYFVWFAI